MREIFYEHSSRTRPQRLLSIAYFIMQFFVSVHNKVALVEVVIIAENKQKYKQPNVDNFTTDNILQIIIAFPKRCIVS